MTNKGKAVIYTIYSCLSYLVVMSILFIWKWDEYISEQGTKIGMFGIIVISLVILCLRSKIIKLIEHSNLLFLFSFIGFAFCFFVESLTAELKIIFGFTMLGSALSSVFDRVVKVYQQNAYKIIDGIRTPNKDKALPEKEAWQRAFGINFKAE